MFYEISYKHKESPKFIVLHSSLANMFGDAWFNSYQNRFIVRAFDRKRADGTLKVINSMLQDDLGLTFREIGPEDPTLSNEERQWMQDLLQKWVEIQETINQLRKSQE